MNFNDGSNLYISLPVISEEWVDGMQEEFWLGGVAMFRSQKPEGQGAAFASAFHELRESSPVRFSSLSEMCESLVVSRVQRVVSAVFKDAGLWGVPIAGAGDIETYNQAVLNSFDALAGEITAEWARALRVEL